MPLGRNPSGSQVKYITALSPALYGATASTSPFDLSGFEWATVVVTTGCVSSGFTVNMERSGTSNGTFANFGASLPNATTGSGQTLIRSFATQASANWYKASYAPGVGSATASIHIIASQPRNTPVDQVTSPAHTVYSDVLNG